MAEPDAVPQKSEAGRIAGPKKRPHPPLGRFEHLSPLTCCPIYLTRSISNRTDSVQLFARIPN